MSQHNSKVVAALGLAGLALGLSIYAVVREPPVAAPAGACVDEEARAQTAMLRRALADRDARDALQARQASAGAAVEPAPPPAAAAPPEEPDVEAPPVRERPRFTRFETSNPAVTVTQKPDGSYDIRTTDPALAGSVLEVTAVGAGGQTQQMLIRVP